MSLQFGKLVFPLDNSLVADWSRPETADLFEGDNLVLYLQPADYRPIFNTDAQVVRGYVSSVALAPLPNIELEGFEATIRDNRAAGFYVLRSLIALSTANPEYVEPIVVRDYIMPDNLAIGYTERRGVLQVEPAAGMMVDEGGMYWIGGYRIIFQAI